MATMEMGLYANALDNRLIPTWSCRMIMSIDEVLVKDASPPNVNMPRQSTY